MAHFAVHYSGSVGYYRALVQANDFSFELHEHFVKQSYRTRMEILSPNGVQKLVIPTLKMDKRRVMNSLEICYSENWQKDHWKGLESAYRRSPYFEFYEDKFRPFYSEKTELLIDLNLGLHNLITELLSIDLNSSPTTEYHKEVDQDFRSLDFNSMPNPESYLQVFSDRSVFVPNLSILDALFNLGPQAKQLLLR
jgi:hypothetical protein